MGMRLLLVEDEADIAETLTAYLERNGFVVDRAPTLEIARDVLDTETFDLVIVDRLLPDGDGIALIAHAEATARPQRFLLLSALAGIDDKVSGLELGARDYVAKPFEPRELLARIRSALRQSLQVKREVRHFGPLAYDVESGGFTLEEAPLPLRRAEALVLAALMMREGALVRRETLESRVYGYDKIVNANSLESTVSRLRKTLAEHSARVHIRAVRGVGYQLEAR